ncbi:MAG: protein kinase [Xenococcaceae cyanobacterium MO_188.B32]|nr:protein kinase [Xenococcaceae cyanobacterium MO_188.B32]
MTSAVDKKLQDGKYILLKELGEGGFGRTYQAVNQILERVVVIKTFKSLPSQENKVADIRKQFLNEAQRLVRCYHSNIVRFYEFFIEDGVPYIVMDYIEGQTLDKIVFPNNPLPEATAIKYIRQVGEALKVVHSKGLLHRDIKPQNLILSQDTQQVMLIDFGIAREFNQGIIQTHTNVVSDGYAPIEQYLPKAKRTPASDIYGLAATMYTLVTAQIPIAATLRNRLALNTPKDIRPELSDRISQAIMQGMALEQEERPNSVEEWLSLLPQTDNKIMSDSVKTISLMETENKPANLSTASQVTKPSYNNRILLGLITFAAMVWGLDYVWLRFQASSLKEKTQLNSVEQLTPNVSPVTPTQKSEPVMPEKTQEFDPTITPSNSTSASSPETVSPEPIKKSIPSNVPASSVSSPKTVSPSPTKGSTVSSEPTKKSTPTPSPIPKASPSPNITPPQTRKTNSNRVPSIFVSPPQKAIPKTNNSSDRIPSVFVSPNKLNRPTNQTKTTSNPPQTNEDRKLEDKQRRRRKRKFDDDDDD